MSIEPIREAPRISKTRAVFSGSAGWALPWLLLGLFMVPMQAWAEAPTADSTVNTARLLPVRVPDLTRVEADVRHALELARTELDAQLASADRRQLAELFGNTGLLYQAHLILEPAAACYENAARLMPRDHRWPRIRIGNPTVLGRSSHFQGTTSSTGSGQEVSRVWRKRGGGRALRSFEEGRCPYWG
jgi:hypothetical protein